jgi:integrase
MAMSVKIRPYRTGGWEVDVTVRLPNGSRLRERSKAPVSSKSAAQRWGQDRERHLVQHGPPGAKEEVPTLKEFAQRFVDGHARANRHKPSGIWAKETILRVHLVPLLGAKRLDAITSEDVQRLKTQLQQKAPKTVNNVLTVLNTLLKKAIEWDVIAQMPGIVRLLPISKGSTGFYDFDEYERLVEAAKSVDPNAHLIVLLGGEAGLRCGEMIALEWTDVDFAKRQLCVERSDWRGQVTTTKGGRLRYVPLTIRLAAALQKHRHLRGARVLCQCSGSPLTPMMVQQQVRRAARVAQLAQSGVHRLRHTFCSHLSMRGAPVRAIQDLAGHMHLTTTQRYMHLSPAAIEGAIRLLDHGKPVCGFGDMLETADREIGKSLS